MVWPGPRRAADDARVQPARRRPPRRVRSTRDALASAREPLGFASVCAVFRGRSFTKILTKRHPRRLTHRRTHSVLGRSRCRPTSWKGVQLAQTHLALGRRSCGWCRVARRCGRRGAVGEEQVRAQSASSALKSGGILRVNIAGTDVDSIDPQIAYGTTSWNIEYSTAVKLLNYPDAKAPRGARIRPEGASRYTISHEREDVHVLHPSRLPLQRRHEGDRPALRVRDQPALGRDLQSPAFAFIADPNATNIVGAEAVRAGQAQNASGVRARGNRLIVRLTKANPAFLAELTMPFFQATHTKLSRTKEVISVSGQALPSPGPYYVAAREPEPLDHPPAEPALRFYAAGRAAPEQHQPDQHDDEREPGVGPQPGRRRPGRLSGRHPACGAREVEPSLQQEQDALLGVPVELRVLHGAEQLEPAVPGQRTAAEGCQLRHQPQGDGQPVRRLRRDHDRSDPAAAASGLPEQRNIYPDTPNLGRARTLARGATRNGTGNSVSRADAARPHGGPARRSQPRRNRYQHGDSRLPRFRNLRGQPAAAVRTTLQRLEPVGARTIPTRTTSSTSCCTAGTSRLRTTTTSRTSTTRRTTGG